MKRCSEDSDACKKMWDNIVNWDYMTTGLLVKNGDKLELTLSLYKRNKITFLSNVESTEHHSFSESELENKFFVYLSPSLSVYGHNYSNLPFPTHSAGSVEVRKGEFEYKIILICKDLGDRSKPSKNEKHSY